MLPTRHFILLRAVAWSSMYYLTPAIPIAATLLTAWWYIEEARIVIFYVIVAVAGLLFVYFEWDDINQSRTDAWDAHRQWDADADIESLTDWP